MTLFNVTGSGENITSINSTGNSLFVYFTSDYSVSKKGFSATYYTNRVGKNTFLLITCRHTINLFIFDISTYRVIWARVIFFKPMYYLPFFALHIFFFNFDNIFKLSEFMTYFGVYVWNEGKIKDG